MFGAVFSDVQRAGEKKRTVISMVVFSVKEVDCSLSETKAPVVVWLCERLKQCHPTKTRCCLMHLQCG